MEIVVIAQSNGVTMRLCSELNSYGFQCNITNINNALEQIRIHSVKLLVVEFNDPTEFESLFRYLSSESGLPIMAIVSLGSLDRLDGYVDDFIIKPCNMQELAARVKRLIKKFERVSKKRISVGDIIIDPDKYEVYANSRLISLTFKEFELLKFLASHPGKVFTRDSLLNQVWSEDYFGGDRTVDVHIRRLRSKIEDPSHIYIDTVRNMGYRFVVR